LKRNKNQWIWWRKWSFKEPGARTEWRLVVIAGWKLNDGWPRISKPFLHPSVMHLIPHWSCSNSRFRAVPKCLQAIFPSCVS
jgi:hypothetical protein